MTNAVLNVAAVRADTVSKALVSFGPFAQMVAASAAGAVAADARQVLEAVGVPVSATALAGCGRQTSETVGLLVTGTSSILDLAASFLAFAAEPKS